MRFIIAKANETIMVGQYLLVDMEEKFPLAYVVNNGDLLSPPARSCPFFTKTGVFEFSSPSRRSHS